MAPADAVPARAGRTYRGRLAFRLAAALCLGAAAILAAAGLVNVRLQREHMTELVRDSADRIADVVLRSTRAAMLDDSPAEAQRIIDAIAAQKGIERIRIFDKQGRVQKSSLRSETGMLVDTRAEQCFACHAEDEPLERLEGTDRVRTFEHSGARVLGVILPIRNAPDCSSAPCHAHPASQSVLGVLDVHLSLAQVDERLAASGRQMVAGVAATVGAVLVLAGGLVWWMVLRPVRRLRVAMGRVAAGDLAAQTAVQSDDELGAMAGSWNEMVSELSRVRDELEQWSRTLETRVADATRELDAAHRRMVLVEKMASLGKLAATVAHEINNPLAGIATYARLLRRRAEKAAAAGGPPADPDTLKALDLVETEAVRCGEIVRNLLAFTRTPASRFSDEDLGPVLERCAALVRHRAELQQIVMRVETAPGTPRVECDPSQVQQVALALAMNAIEAMPRGGRLTLSVRPDAGAPEGGAVLEVSDTGCGIPADVLPHVFEPFFTTKSESKGAGLGLAVVYGIVQRHHGQVDVRTAVPGGTTFSVRLPRRQPPAPAADAPGAQFPAAAAPAAPGVQAGGAIP